MGICLYLFVGQSVFDVCYEVIVYMLLNLSTVKAVFFYSIYWEKMVKLVEIFSCFSLISQFHGMI